MASAAAVEANLQRSPMRNDVGEDHGRIGEITSGIYRQDEDIEDGIKEASPVKPVADDEDDDDEDAPSRRMRKGKSAEPDDGGNGGDDLGLFGDEDDEEAEEPKEPQQRLLDDEELDSGDDMDRADRAAEQEEPEVQEPPPKRALNLELSRDPIPEPSDGEMYVMKMPTFMSLEPHAWDHTTFQPPTTDHHSKSAPGPAFSAYNTALTTMRWRHSPSNPSQLQSNARIHRWSDGSLTLQLASDPNTQYEMDGNALAPPQRNPIKPTPVSTKTATPATGRPGQHKGDKYDPNRDAFTYLARPHAQQDALRITHKLTAGLSVKQSGNLADDAIQRLNASMAAAANASRVQGASGKDLAPIDVDPEQAKREALNASRQSEKLARKMQAASDREAARNSRAMGRSGLSSSRYSGLNVGMLEDDEEGGGGAAARGGRKQPRGKPKGGRRRNSEYSEDEDFGRKRFAQREDEYDEEDDFLAPSDEEEEGGGDGDEEDEEDVDDGIVEERSARKGTPKRDRAAAAADDEADAPGEDDEEEGVQQARTKRRRVVDEDEEDE